jgi:mRNA-decapping enzyme subunit 2
LNVRPEPSSNGIILIEENLPPLSNDRTAHTSAPPPSQPRRATSTADILPYLTRATDDVQISATRLKQLSLLETVADESARMSSVIAARAAMTSTNPVVNGYPLLPQSVPPPSQSMMLGNTRDPGLIYSSDHPRVPSHALGVQPIYNSLENNFYGEHDASQFRSRTSQSIHRTLTHNPTGSINVHQSHLLAALNGSRTPSLYTSQYGPPTRNVSMYPRHITPSQMFHSAPQPRSTVTDFTSVNRGLHPATVYPPYNPSLLSILNTRSSQPPTVPAQFHQ